MPITCSLEKSRSVCLIAFFAVICLLQIEEIEADNSNLLLIGNSYAAGNGLRQSIAAMIEETATTLVNSFQYTPGAYKFVTHLADTAKETQLQSLLVTDPMPWTWVVLQEQSQVGGFYTIPRYFNPSIAAAESLDRLIQGSADGASTIYFMTWGRRNGDPSNPGLYPDFLTMNNKIQETYKRYSIRTSTTERPTLVAPVGVAFEKVYESTSDPLESESDFYSLYSGDGSHPSVRGSYLAACVLYATMTGRDPRGLVYIPDGVNAASRIMLQTAAYNAMIEYHNWYPEVVQSAPSSPPSRISGSPLPQSLSESNVDLEAFSFGNLFRSLFAWFGVVARMFWDRTTEQLCR